MGVGYILTHTLVKGHADSINCLSFSLCGSYLASGADDYRLLIWRVQDGSLLYEIMFESAVNAVIWDPCSEDTIICGCNDGLLYRAKNFCLDGFKGQTIDLGVRGPVHSLDFDRGSKCFAVGMGHAVVVSRESSTGMFKGSVRMPDPEVSHTGSLEDWRIRPIAVHFHENGRKLIVAYLNHGVIIWDVYTQNRVWETGCLKISSCSGGLSFCNQTDMLSIHTLHDGVHIYHVGRRKLCRVLHHGHESQTSYHPLSVSTTLNGDTIVGGSNSGKVCVWQAHTGELLQVLEHGGSKHPSLFSVCQVSGKWIATGTACGGQDSYIAIWAADSSVGG
ncbi:WD40-repeat-containing domain protein [Suillus cothurnatus]|nr:WD40-repeat-containing domain protein [Suillus cothurnatus]